MVAAPFVEVPPRKYGGTERVINDLVTGLGSENEVVLLASGDSEIDSELESICGVALFNDPTYDHTTQRWERLGEINEKTERIIRQVSPDIVHLHDYDNPDLIRRLKDMQIPTLVSIGHAKTDVIWGVFEEFVGAPMIHFNALTKQHARQFSETMPWVFNGVDFSKYSPVNSFSQKGNYFLSIGDMKPIKGHATAIKLARLMGKSLLIVGAPYYPESLPYFTSEVLPFVDLDVSGDQKGFIDELEDGRLSPKERIIYFGSASDEQKRELYRHAQFTQFLGHFERAGVIEAFGLTMIESLASGTPILGSSGPAEEILQNGGTGEIVYSLEEAASKAHNLMGADPSEVRRSARESFSHEVMADNYSGLYQKILNNSN